MPLDALIGYIEKTTKLLAFTDCEDAGVFMIPVTCSSGKADEALLKAQLQNTRRFHVTPSNRHGSLESKSNMLEYLHLHSCGVDDLAEELRAWSDLPMLSPYKSVSAGTDREISQKSTTKFRTKQSVKKLQTLNHQNVSLADVLAREANPVVVAAWQARRASEQAQQKQEREREAALRRAAEEEQKRAQRESKEAAQRNARQEREAASAKRKLEALEKQKQKHEEARAYALKRKSRRLEMESIRLEVAQQSVEQIVSSLHEEAGACALRRKKDGAPRSASEPIVIDSSGIVHLDWIASKRVRLMHAGETK